MKTLRKRTKLESCWLHSSGTEIVSQWCDHLLMKPNFKIWIAFHSKIWDLNSLNKSFTSERESPKDLKSRPWMASNLTETCTATWCLHMLLPSMKVLFLTFRMHGITCAKNNAKRFKKTVKLFLTNNSETIWDSQFKKITSTLLAKMLLICAWWTTEKKR